MSARDQAKKSLVFYFRTLYQKCGINWDSDNVAEIEDIVDDIIAATVEETLNEIEEKKQRMKEDGLNND